MTSAAHMIIKNTFLELQAEDGDAAGRRSSSVPRCWKPSPRAGDRSPCPGSDVSTVFSSDGDISETSGGSPILHFGLESEYAEREGDSNVGTETVGRSRLNPRAVEFHMPASSQQLETRPLQHQQEAALLGSTPLNPEALAFDPEETLSNEVASVVSAVKRALVASPKVKSLQMIKGDLGSSTTVVAEVWTSGQQGMFAPRDLQNSAKSALLAATARSTQTYVLGYSSTPFEDLPNSEFQCTICVLPKSCEATACWDTYGLGFCRRPATCRWYHPTTQNMMKLRVVMLPKPEASRAEA